MSDRQHVQEACAITDAYVAELRKNGLPTPPNWGALSCDKKIIAFASVFGGGSLAGAAEAASFIVAIVHADSELHWLRDRAKDALDTVAQFDPGRIFRG